MGLPDQPHAPRGRFDIDPRTDDKAAAAARLRAQRKTYQQIADELGLADRGHAWRLVQRARETVLRPAAEELLRSEAEQLDELYAQALEILDRDHILVSHGKVVVGDDGQPLLDDGPKLAAIRELRSLRESFRRLHGLDAETKVNVTGAVRYEVVGVDVETLQ